MKFRSPGHRPVEVDSAASAAIEIAGKLAVRHYGRTASHKALVPRSWSTDGAQHRYSAFVCRMQGPNAWIGRLVEFVVTRA